MAKKQSTTTLIRMSEAAKRWLIRKAGGPRKLGRYIEQQAAAEKKK